MRIFRRELTDGGQGKGHNEREIARSLLELSKPDSVLTPSSTLLSSLPMENSSSFVQNKG